MKNYLVLFNLAQANQATGKKLIDNLKKVAIGPVAPIWFDAAYGGVPLGSGCSASDIWNVAVEGLAIDIREVLVVELGRDWMARGETKAANWLTSHLGHSLPETKLRA